NQLAKCAEALALRKAFPKVLAKVYVAEEMAQADNEVPPAPPTPKPETKPKAAAPSVDLDALAKDFERVIGEVVTSKGTLADLRSIGTLIAKSPLDESRRAHLQDVWLTARDFVTGRQPGED
ncbi:MAG TPA: hypothetical protein VEA38_14495, partial [Terriglobales bacterium]|nr:hypothetical protein [Terriglobales bacterium]